MRLDFVVGWVTHRRREKKDFTTELAEVSGENGGLGGGGRDRGVRAYGWALRT